MKRSPFKHDAAADAGGGGVKNSPTLGKLQRNVAFIYIFILCPPIRNPQATIRKQQGNVEDLYFSK